MYTLTEPLYLTTDRSEAVEPGDPRARFYLGGKGIEIPDVQAVALGLKAPRDKSRKGPPNTKMVDGPLHDKEGSDADDTTEDSSTPSEASGDEVSSSGPKKAGGSKKGS